MIFGKSQVIIFLCQLFLVAVLVVSCQGSQNSPVVSSVSNGCVQKYDSNVDYFPNKVKVTHAIGFAVEYYKNYKVVTIKNPGKMLKQVLNMFWFNAVHQYHQGSINPKYLLHL